MFSKRTRLLLLALPLFSLNAEVFLRIPRSPETIMRSLGGSEVYRSAITINGSKGELRSFIFNESSDVTAKRLSQKLKLPPPHKASAIILDAKGKSLTRYFVIQAPGIAERTLVTALEQKSAIFKNAAKITPAWPADIPALNATAQFTARCEKTRTTFVTAISHSSTPEQAVTEASAVLSGDGWEEMIPSTPTFRIFTQDIKQRVVFADENSSTHEVTINILQREGTKQ